VVPAGEVMACVESRFISSAISRGLVRVDAAVGSCSGTAWPGWITPCRRRCSPAASGRVVDDEALAVDLELAVARILDRAGPSLTWKKPRPLMARSSGLSVVVMLPCVNCCDTADSCVPMPTVGAGAVQRRGVEVGELGARGLGP
jgi:hypothetical protein